MIEPTISVEVRAFAAAADAMGCRESECILPAKTTIRDAWVLLIQKAPELASLEDTIAFARNDTMATRDTSLENGDTLSLLPPVSGG